MIVCTAMMYQARAVMPDDMALAINPRVAKHTTYDDSTIAVNSDVNNGGFVGPMIVGIKANANAHDPTDITQSCHMMCLLWAVYCHAQDI
jgi:hypothetical protein